MQDAEGAPGHFLDRGSGLRGVHAQVQFLHAGLKDVAANDADGEQEHQQQERQPLKGAAAVEPLGDEMGEGQAGAPLLKGEVALKDKLGGSSGMGAAEQLQHGVGEERGADREGKEDNRAEPNRRVEHS